MDYMFMFDERTRGRLRVVCTRRRSKICNFNQMVHLGIVLLCVHIIRAIGSNDILRLNIPTEPNLDPNTVCKTYPDLTEPQYDLCSRYPDVTASAIQGVQIAIHECQYQLETYRWNCSTLERKNKNPHSSPLLQKGFKETAFAYAISSAGVTHQVSKACSLGKLRSCGCDMTNQGAAEKWEWGGCSHNMEFGERFTIKFTDAKERAKDVHARINLHNNKIGRKIVIQNARTKCKCHGMSGSCELKTCWKAAPDFRDVGDKLKAKFDGAKRVYVPNISNGHLFSRRRRRRRRWYSAALLFYEKSPNFCDIDPEIDSPGTLGRFCNNTNGGADNCDDLCCGRGYDTLRVRREERCDCKFHWCCYVKCQTCVYNEWVTVCK